MPRKSSRLKHYFIIVVICTTFIIGLLMQNARFDISIVVKKDGVETFKLDSLNVRDASFFSKQGLKNNEAEPIIEKENTDNLADFNQENVLIGDKNSVNLTEIQIDKSPNLLLEYQVGQKESNMTKVLLSDPSTTTTTTVILKESNSNSKPVSSLASSTLASSSANETPQSSSSSSLTILLSSSSSLSSSTATLSSSTTLLPSSSSTTLSSSSSTTLLPSSSSTALLPSSSSTTLLPSSSSTTLSSSSSTTLSSSVASSTSSTPLSSSSLSSTTLSSSSSSTTMSSSSPQPSSTSSPVVAKKEPSVNPPEKAPGKVAVSVAANPSSILPTKSPMTTKKPLNKYPVRNTTPFKFIPVKKDLWEGDNKTGEVVYKRKGTVVLVVAYYRGGSTFFGELFNQNPDTFYLFEPLEAFGIDCAREQEKYDPRLVNSSMEVLENISKCDFRKIGQAYSNAYKLRNATGRRECTTNICFLGQSGKAIDKIKKLCTYNTMGRKSEIKPIEFLNTTKLMENYKPKYYSVRCRMKFDPFFESSICYSSKIVAYKMIRLCRISRLQLIYKRLKEEGNDVYVIHLVRDPRAITSSAMKLNAHHLPAVKYAENLCKRMRENLAFEKHIKEGNVIPQNRFLRVRYEDMATDVINIGEKVYSFLGQRIPPELSEWMEEKSMDVVTLMNLYKDRRDKAKLPSEQMKWSRKRVQIQKSLKDPYSTVKNSKTVLRKWRDAIQLPIVMGMQQVCTDVLNELKYRIVHNFTELHDQKPLYYYSVN